MEVEARTRRKIEPSTALVEAQLTVLPLSKLRGSAPTAGMCVLVEQAGARRIGTLENRSAVLEATQSMIAASAARTSVGSNSQPRR